MGMFINVLIWIIISIKKYINRIIIKEIINGKSDLDHALGVIREISILNACDHPNIPKILKIIVPENIKSDNIFMIEEDRGKDLIYIMSHSPQISGWNSDHIKYIIYEVFRTLLYLHV